MTSSDPVDGDLSRVDLESLAADASAARALEGLRAETETVGTERV